MIKAVLFDLGRVIIPFDFQRGYKQIEELTGVPAPDIPVRIGATDLVNRFESGQVSSREFFAELCRILHMDISFERFKEIWSSIFLPDPLLPEAMLEGIARRYRMVLVSNTNEIHFDMVRERYPLLRHFHAYVLSHEVKAMKPSPVIFQAAVEQAGCRPQECFFTDDIAAYVEGARAQGIDAVQFQSCEQIQGELRARGVSWE